MSEIELRNGHSTTDPRLGFLSQTDPRNDDHKVHKADTEPVNWASDIVLNQETNGACVGFAMTHALRAQGWQHPLVDHSFAWGVYVEAQKIDPWRGGQYPGANPQMVGTSLLAAAQVLKSKGYIEKYQWASTTAQVRSGLATGPAVLGCIWRKSMDDITDAGLVDVTGIRDGGHAVVITGFDDDTFTILNSWGDSWGNNGTAKIADKDLKKLLRDRAGRVVFPRAATI